MNIFVARLDYGTTAETVQALFEEFGEVSSAKIITDKETGRSKGFGFVEMSDDDAAREAIEAISGTEVDGREIFCKESEPRENRREGGNRGAGGAGGRRRFNRNDRGGSGDRFSRNDRNDRGGSDDRFNRRDDRW